MNPSQKAYFGRELREKIMISQSKKAIVIIIDEGAPARNA